MQNLVVVGLQWGDEGKGKIVDVLSENFDIVTRFQGGSNAGHTVKIGDDIFKFRIIPTGVVRGKKVIIGNGVVVDPIVLQNEIEMLSSAGIIVDLLISDRAHLITPYQILADSLQEEARGNLKVGTTRRGIGPTYADKVSRVGIRFSELLDIDNSPEFQLFKEQSESKITFLSGNYNDSGFQTQMASFHDSLQKLKSFVVDTSEFLNREIESGKRVLFEGAQGTLLDIDHGTYPFVTSSNCVSASAAFGTGVAPTRLDSILGIAKAYLTRVGTGPFPTELDNEVGHQIRERGAEYGTVTGRPRRCGWLDLVALKYAVRLNGAQFLAITKLDVLSGIDPLKICVAYEIDGSEVRNVPASSLLFSKALPIYEEVEGWSKISIRQSDSDINDLLPDALLSYLKTIETWTQSKVAMLSLGPDRADTIILPNVFPEGSIHV